MKQNIVQSPIFMVGLLTISLASALVYVLVQQDIRQSANDPQIQMAEDGAARLSAGVEPTGVLPATKVDISQSLAPYMLIFDDSGHLLVSSALLDGVAPAYPAGVLENVRLHGEERVTWQPKPEVRAATVVTRFQGKASGFVMVGRSLREVETRESQVAHEAAAAWFAGIIILILATLYYENRPRKV